MDQQQLLSRLAEDPGFREELRADPDGALERRGVEMSEEQRRGLHELDLGGSDEQLAERISKYNRSFSDLRLKRAVRVALARELRWTRTSCCRGWPRIRGFGRSCAPIRRAPWSAGGWRCRRS